MNFAPVAAHRPALAVASLVTFSKLSMTLARYDQSTCPRDMSQRRQLDDPRAAICVVGPVRFIFRS